MMSDDIDLQPVSRPRRTGTYQFCPRCGMVLSGVTCGFCKDLKLDAPKKDYWVGRVRG